MSTHPSNSIEFIAKKFDLPLERERIEVVKDRLYEEGNLIASIRTIDFGSLNATTGMTADIRVIFEKNHDFGEMFT